MDVERKDEQRHNNRMMQMIFFLFNAVTAVKTKPYNVDFL